MRPASQVQPGPWHQRHQPLHERRRARTRRGKTRLPGPNAVGCARGAANGGVKRDAAELALELRREREHSAVLEVWADDLQADRQQAVTAVDRHHRSGQAGAAVGRPLADDVDVDP